MFLLKSRRKRQGVRRNCGIELPNDGCSTLWSFPRTGVTQALRALLRAFPAVPHQIAMRRNAVEEFSVAA